LAGKVARRIAHEIKNPLTPIQAFPAPAPVCDSWSAANRRNRRPLVTPKLAKLGARMVRPGSSGRCLRLPPLVNEVFGVRALPCRQAGAHQCQHHRHQAVEKSSPERLDGITLKTTFCRESPRSARRRRTAPQRGRGISSTMPPKPLEELGLPGNPGFHHDPNPMRKTVVICVFGHRAAGISPQDKEQTLPAAISPPKDRGTGTRLGHRCPPSWPKHGGSIIHVEDNLPVGSRFPCRNFRPREGMSTTTADQNGSERDSMTPRTASPRRGRRSWHSGISLFHFSRTRATTWEAVLAPPRKPWSEPPPAADFEVHSPGRLASGGLDGPRRR